MSLFKPYRSYLKKYSRNLRQSMTEAECLLWSKVRRKQIFGVQFYRQKPLGFFIVDFYAPKVQLIVEVDGGHHFEPKQRKEDAKRDAYFFEMNLKVLRYDNYELLTSVDEVVQDIAEVVRCRLKKCHR